MIEKHMLKLLIVTIGIFFISSNSTIGQSKKQPNVLLIMLDDLNDYTGFLGGHPQAQTPYMDALAKESVVFTNSAYQCSYLCTI